MKTIRRIIIPFLLALLLAAPGLTASALDAPFTPEAPAARVIDKGNVWTEEAEKDFREKVKEFADRSGTDVVLLSVTLLYDASLGDGIYDSVTEFAKDYFEVNGYGAGEDRTGLILVLSAEPSNRQTGIYASGREKTAYSLEDLAYMNETLQPFLVGRDFDGAANRFLELAAVHEAKGRFEDQDKTAAESSDMLWTLGLAAIVAWAITSSMRRRMNPVANARVAHHYAVRGSYELRHYNEIFLGTTVTRQPRGQVRR